MKTAELIGPALDWAVASIEGVLFPRSIPKYSSDWAQGGPIMDRVATKIEDYGEYWGVEGPGAPEMFGPTMLIAAMRCYVASKLGDEIEIPKELK